MAVRAIVDLGVADRGEAETIGQEAETELPRAAHVLDIMGAMLVARGRRGEQAESGGEESKEGEAGHAWDVDIYLLYKTRAGQDPVWGPGAATWGY